MSKLEAVDPLLILKSSIKLLNLTGFNFECKPAVQTKKGRHIFWMRAFYWGFLLCNIVIRKVLQFLVLLSAVKDLESFSALSGMLLTFVPTWRSVMIWSNNTLILDVMAELKETNIEVLPENAKKSLEKSLRKFKISQKLGLIMQALLAFAFVSAPFVKCLISGSWYNEAMWDFPIKVDNKALYNLAFIWSQWVLINQGFLFTSQDLIVCGLIFHLSMKFKVLNFELELALKNKQSLKKFVEKHSKAISLTAQVNQLFSCTFFLFFISWTFAICLVLLQIANSCDTMSMIKFGALLVMLIAQVGLMCFMGSSLETSSTSLAHTIYDSNCFETDDKDLKTACKIILMQSQKPCQIKAWKFATFNNETLKNILNASHSYYTSLKSFKAR